MYEQVLMELAKKVPMNPHKSDYIKDGLIWCGECHTPKQATIQLNEKTVIVPCMCKCTYEQEEMKRQKTPKEKELETIAKKIQCFGHELYNCLKRKTFENDNGSSDRVLMKKALDYADNFASNKQSGTGLLLYGDNGNGKSYASCCIANRLVDNGYSVRFIKMSDVEISLWGADDKEEVYHELMNCDLLIIDDLGAERDKAYMNEITFNLIDKRTLLGKPLIVTCNLTPQELLKSTDRDRKRIYSRLNGACIPVQVKGHDMRIDEMKVKMERMKHGK